MNWIRRIFREKPPDRMKLWLVMNRGYDYVNDKIHAVCTTEQRAIELFEKLMKEQGKPLPWNQRGYMEIESDVFIKEVENG